MARVQIPAGMRWLPRLGGVPVPYVAHWTGEDGKARLEPYDGDGFSGPCVTHDDLRGHGVPVLGQMSYRRQREVIGAKRCQVCRRPLGRVSCVLLDAPRIQTFGPLFGSFLLTEPPCCRSCMTWVKSYCPGIARALGSGTAKLARIRSWTTIGVIVRPVGDPDLDKAFAPLTALDMADGALGYLKIAVDAVEPWA